MWRRRLLFCLLLAVVLLLAIVVGCREKPAARVKKQQPEDPSPFQISLSPAKSPAQTAQVEPTLGGLYFSEVHEQAGLQHVYRNGECGRSLMNETIGGGGGWLDYDGDGHWDLYLNQGGDSTADPDEQQPNDALFRNLGDGTFQDVTVQAGIRERRYGQGVAIGDFDNDGFDDIYVTNVGGNTLFHNEGDGTFREVTEHAGVRDGRWSVSAAWADLDLDGNLDLYVGNYVQYDPKHPLECKNRKGENRICHPRELAAWPGECYMNQGDGTFRPEAQRRGLVAPGSKSLGVAVADFNNDGLPDVYVCNDTTPNFLFLNKGNGFFEESALLLGCAVDREGSTHASMGIAVADYDGNGYLDIFITSFYEEGKILYKNLGAEGFQDVTGLVGLHDLTFLRLGFGTVMVDFNQDGRPDIFMTTGHVENFPGNPLYKMQPQLLTFDGVRWLDRTKQAGPFFQGKYVGRGAALCDYDEDGDWDIAVMHENSSLALLRNDSQRGHWLKFLFRGRASNRRGIGCRVTVTAGTAQTMQELCGGTSYACTHQPTLIFGLGEYSGPCSARVRWPSGQVQTLTDLSVNQTLFVDEPVGER